MPGPAGQLPPTEPIDMRLLLAPADLDAVATARTNDVPVIVPVPANSAGPLDPDEPTYGDFLREPTA